MVTANGWREGYGAEIYLMGVFGSKKEAYKATHNRLLPYSTHIQKVPINKAFPLRRNYDHRLEDDDNYSNLHYLGGHTE